jgi:hypothetical protein
MEAMLHEPSFEYVFRAVALTGSPFFTPAKHIFTNLVVDRIPSDESLKTTVVKIFEEYVTRILLVSYRELRPLFRMLIPDLPVSPVLTKVAQWVMDRLSSELEYIESYAASADTVETAISVGSLILELVPSFAIDGLLVSYGRIVKGFAALSSRHDDLFTWIGRICRHAPAFDRDLFEEFKNAFDCSDDRNVHKIACAWAKFEILAHEKYSRLSDIYYTVREKSSRALKMLFVLFREFLGDPEFVQFATTITAETFCDETVQTNCSDLFFQTGLKNMDGDLVVALFLVICEGIVDLADDNQRANAVRAGLVVSARPDLKSMLVELFPIRERESLEAADLLNIADMFFS